MRRLVLLASLIAIAGCGDDDSTTTTASDSGTLVTYARSGGVAAMPESLVVRTDGSATVEAGVTGAREDFTLEEEELDQLREELEAADFGEILRPPEPSACNDCFVYEVSYGPHTVSYDDGTSVIPGSVVTVVSHLAEITSDHYPPDAARPTAAG